MINPSECESFSDTLLPPALFRAVSGHPVRSPWSLKAVGFELSPFRQVVTASVMILSYP